MPQRTTPFQMIVAFVRMHSAGPGITVTESKMLHDPVLDVDREVDVVIEGDFDGEPVVTSIEVIEHSQAADITWVEQQIAKHRNLATNRLVLVSKSGFSRTALTAIATQGGWVDAVTPEVVVENGEPVAETLFVDQVNATITASAFTVVKQDGSLVRVEVFPDNSVVDDRGNELGGANELTNEIMWLDWVGQALVVEAHDHPEREALTHFQFGLDVGDLGYFLREEATGELHRVEQVHLVGEFSWTQEVLDLTHARLARKAYESGEAKLFGRQTVFVVTNHDDGQRKLSARPADGKPHPLAVPMLESPKFPGLLSLDPVRGTIPGQEHDDHS